MVPPVGPIIVTSVPGAASHRKWEHSSFFMPPSCASLAPPGPHRTARRTDVRHPHRVARTDRHGTRAAHWRPLGATAPRGVNPAQGVGTRPSSGLFGFWLMMALIPTRIKRWPFYECA